MVRIKLPSIPRDWELKEISSLARISTGSSKPGGGHRYVVLDMGSVDRTGNLVAKKLTDDSSDVMRMGELVMPKDDIGGGQIIGKAVMVDRDDSYVLGDHVYRLTIFDGDPAFIRYAINSDSVNASLRRKVVGSAQLGLPRRAVEEQMIPFPPIGEQRAIVAALSDASAWVESLDALILKKRDVKKAAHQSLLSGSTRLTGFREDWRSVSLNAICRPRTSKVASVSALLDAVCVDLEDIEPRTGRLVGQSKLSDSRSGRTLFYEGDVLFGKLRAYLQKYWHASCDGVCSAEIWALEPLVGECDSRYLEQLVTTARFVEAASATYGTHMPRSDWTIVGTTKFHVPGVEEQRAIGTFLADMDAEIDALVAQRDKAELIRQGMAQDLLTGKVRLI